MPQNPYDYATRQGFLPISWEDFHGLCKALALGVAAFAPQVILPVGRGGFYPGTLIAHLLQVDVHPVRLSRRANDVVRYDTPRWILEPPATLRGKRVLVVDEISSTGETLRLVCRKVTALGAAQVRSAVLAAHTRGAAVPDYIGLISDALILNPWDREILRDGKFTLHPEYAAALAEQGLEPHQPLILPATPFQLAKG